jgi:hypothetical protein
MFSHVATSLQALCMYFHNYSNCLSLVMQLSANVRK